MAEPPLSVGRVRKNHLGVICTSSMAGQREMFPRSTCGPHAGCCLELSKDLISGHTQGRDHLDRRSESHLRAPARGGSERPTCADHLYRQPSPSYGHPGHKTGQTGLLSPHPTLSSTQPRGVRNWFSSLK